MPLPVPWGEGGSLSENLAKSRLQQTPCLFSCQRLYTIMLSRWKLFIKEMAYLRGLSTRALFWQRAFENIHP